MTWRIEPACLIAALALFVSQAIGQQTENYQLRAVPAPASGVKIDGSLSEWDTSAEILSCYDLAELRDTYSVRTAAMYDGENLYLGYRFRDATPLGNTINPVTNPDSGWRDDCIQLRFWTDPEKPLGPNGGRIAHLTAYYDAADKRPVAQLVYADMARRQAGFESEINDALAAGIEEAFTPDADGKGYTQELKIPFKLLRRDGRAYKAGESLRMGMEFVWGSANAPGWPAHRYADLVNKEHPQRQFFWSAKDAWGELAFLPSGHVAVSPSVQLGGRVEELRRQQFATAGPVPIQYQFANDGYVTLVVETPQGKRIRNLIADYPRKAGANTDYWDGRDDAGAVMPIGEYRARGIYHGSLDVRYQFSYGNPGNPPWGTADGKGSWMSDHDVPVGCAAKDGEVYLSAGNSESGDTLIRVDLNGQRQSGIGRIPGGMLAIHGQYVYMISGGSHPDYPDNGKVSVVRIDRKTGKLAPFGTKSQLSLFDFPKDRAVKPRQWEGALVAAKAFDADYCQDEAMGLASDGKDRLYLSLFYENKVIAFDPEAETILETIPVERPVGIAISADGDLLVVSNKQILKFGTDRKPVPLITAGLDAPMAIALDAKGNSYVSDWGASMCVKVFKPTGEFLHTIGKLGGRALRGDYDPSGMFLPWGLAIDSTGNVWVAEADFSPKRISVWDGEGKLVREICGPGWYGSTESNVDTTNLNRAFWNGNVVDLDWATGQWRVASTLWRPITDEELIGPRGEGLINEVRKIDGREVLVSTEGTFTVISVLNGNTARPAAAFGSIVRVFTPQTKNVLPDLVIHKLFATPEDEAWARKAYPALFTGVDMHRHRLINAMLAASIKRGRPIPSQFLWTDANGDGAVQPDEIEFFRPETYGGLQTMGSTWRMAVGPDLSMYPVVNDSQSTRVYKLSIKQWNEHGAPVYDLASAKLFFEGQFSMAVDSSWANDQNQLLLNGDPLTMLSAEGKMLWSMPNQWVGVHGSHTAPKDRNGRLIGPLKVIGSSQLGGDVGEVLAMSGNTGKAFLFSSDGLMISSLFRDNRSAPDGMPQRAARGLSIAKTTAGGEWFGGEFFRDPTTGKTWIGSASFTAENISELTGLDSIQRLPAVNLIVSEAQHVKATELAAADGAAVPIEPKRMIIEPQAKPAAGKLENVAWKWEEKDHAVQWGEDEKRTAEATWTYDDRYLYVAYRNVKDPTPFVNSGTIWSQLFKTGDSAVFELRTQADNDKPEVIPGDIRLLISLYNNKPVVVLYDYQRPHKAAAMDLASPVITTRIAAVEMLQNAQVHLERQDGTYSVQVAIPLADIGFAPTAGAHFRGDFGIIHSDATGKIDELRMYWANQATGLVSDLGGEARIEPKRWGTFEVAK